MDAQKIYLDRIIGHLGAAQAQRSWLDDRIISSHIDEALAAAQSLKVELTKTTSNKGANNEIHSQ